MRKQKTEKVFHQKSKVTDEEEDDKTVDDESTMVFGSMMMMMMMMRVVVVEVGCFHFCSFLRLVLLFSPSGVAAWFSRREVYLAQENE
jgi:hypothetical protein